MNKTTRRNIFVRNVTIILGLALILAMLPAGISNHVFAASKLKKPSGSVQIRSLKEKGKTVTIQWKKAKKNVKGYQVYRKTKTGKWKKAKTVSGKTATWKDAKKTAGTRYYYKVRAYNKKKGKVRYGAFSKARSVTIPKASTKQAFGVFLSPTEYGAWAEKLHYKTLVIDGQYYSKKEIAALHKNNDVIYSYLNVGALENFRDYYDEYLSLTLGDYENWPEERYVDVSQQEWQNFVVNKLAKELKAKGIDGFFVDNADVYYEYNRPEIYDGLTSILQSLKKMNAKVIINGGDTYVSEFLAKNKTLSPVLDGINQEEVFTVIRWDTNTFGESKKEDREYFLNYAKNVKKSGATVYLLEYTKDRKLAEKIKKECQRLGYQLYISDSIELDA